MAWERAHEQARATSTSMLDSIQAIRH